jgi:hypothetical protein
LAKDWTLTGSPKVSHSDQQAALLQDGRVFTIGEIHSDPA